jgi:hypothetical protein
MQREHIGVEQNADTDVAKPLDVLRQRAMVGLGSIQVGKHHWQGPSGRLTQQPKRQGIGDRAPVKSRYAPNARPTARGPRAAAAGGRP